MFNVFFFLSNYWSLNMVKVSVVDCRVVVLFKDFHLKCQATLSCLQFTVRIHVFLK